MARTPRPATEHRTIVQEAGLGRVSLLSLLAGTLSAYGAFAIVAAVAGSLLAAADVDTEFRTDDWTSSGAVAGLVSGLVLLVAYLFGGYVAGRMARRSGLLHGFGVIVLSLVLGAIVGAVAGASQDSDSIQEDLRGVGVPTSWDQMRGVAIASVAVSLAGLVAGALLGGILGERWHTKLARRVADPERGPAAEARAAAERHRERAERLERERDERLTDDTVVAGEVARSRGHHPGDDDPIEGDGPDVDPRRDDRSSMGGSGTVPPRPDRTDTERDQVSHDSSGRR